MLNHYEQAILTSLYRNKGSYMTSQEIAYKLNVSDKTTRKYIHSLKKKVKANQATIEAAPGHGYQLEVINEQAFHDFFQANEQKSEKQKEKYEPSEERQYMILRELLFNDEPILIDELSDECFVSRSTISNDLTKMKPLLEPYHLKIKSKPNAGIYIDGNEQNKRHFIMKYFFMERLQKNMTSFSSFTEYFTTISIEEILIIVLDECREANLKLSDYIIYNIVMHIALAIKRVEEGNRIEHLNVGDVKKDSVEYQVAEKILSRLTNSLHRTIPDEEVNYIVLHLRSKVETETVYAKDPYSKDEITSQLVTQLNKVDEETGLHLEEDTILIEGLLTHFTPLFMRLQKNEKMKNPLVNRIKKDYSEAFSLTTTYIAKMPIFKQYHMTEDEWAYIALHIIAAIEREYTSNKLKTLVVCATGMGSSQMLKIRLENELGSKLQIDKVISYYEITQQSIEEYDLIVSSIDLSKFVFPIPVVNVSVFLSERDIQLIKKYLGKAKARCIKNSVGEPSGKNDLPQLVNQFFEDDLFLRVEEIKKKEEILDQLIYLAKEYDPSISTDFLRKQLQLRETFNPVVFSEHVAVPHPIEGVSQKSKVAVAIVPNGIEWDEKYTDIRLIFLMLPDRYDYQHLQEVNKAMLPLIEEERLITEFCQCRDFETFKQQFIEKLQ